ncbi:GPI inositol-deacylase [Anthonomus grandis grandis]|uniref:GPI inositol-deacylase n=1 Tax=Anthonomus grandis grandis TaxID=2921223 RepID=UPI002165A9EE|nr:GPI inositol-deacylase [Anthonomus grandis grandis]
MKRGAVLFILGSFIVLLLYLLGLAFVLSDNAFSKDCEMTYMFEYPQYVRISQKIDDKYLKYGLYAYAEGRMTKKARNMHFDGIPVLFIPGSAGSHQQVRSLASVALRKALNSGTPFHFDYFTVDLNKEFSAFYGPHCYDQLEYVLNSIDTVLKLYQTPKQVVLIGHSIGGIVAKKAISHLLKTKRPLVSVLITLASPVRRGLIYFDRHLSQFYSDIDLGDSVMAINIAGGHSDVLVPSYLTRDLSNKSINLVATNVAKCWVESNHVQILWCKQLVLATNRALFDSVVGKEISVDLVGKMFQHHLVHNSGTKVDATKPATIAQRGDWIERLQRQYSVEFKKGLRQPQTYMVGITYQPTYELLTVLALNLEVSNWVFACNAAFPNSKGQRVCTEGEHLSQYSEIAPSTKYKRRLVTLNMHDIGRANKEHTHIIFRAEATSEPVTFHVDIHGSAERESQVTLPIFSLKKHIILRETPENALIYNLIFPELQDPFQIYYLFVEPLKCKVKEHHATASLIVPWANESIHTHFTETLRKPFVLRLQNPKPTSDNRFAKVRLVLEPSCTYTISVKLHILGVFGQISRYYSTFLLSNVATIILLAYQNQLLKMGREKRVPIPFVSLIDGLNIGWVLVLSCSVPAVLHAYLPEPEFGIFPNYIYRTLALIVLFLASYALVWVLIMAFCVSLFTLESTIHKLTLKILAKSVTLTIKFSDYFMTFLHKVPFLVSAALVVLCFSTCGGLALIVGVVFYFLKLTQMSQDYIEEVAWFLVKSAAKSIKNFFRKQKTAPLAIEETTSSVTPSTDDIQQVSKEPPASDRNPLKDLRETNDKIFFHSSMFFIWVFVAALNVPAVVTWAHNYRFSKFLSPDDSFLIGLVFCCGGFFLWHCEFPKLNRKYFKELRLLTISFIPISFLYGALSVYRINYMLTLLFLLTLVQQLLAPTVTNSDETAINDPKDEADKYDEAKMKMH